MQSSANAVNLEWDWFLVGRTLSRMRSDEREDRESRGIKMIKRIGAVKYGRQSETLAQLVVLSWN